MAASRPASSVSKTRDPSMTTVHQTPIEPHERRRENQSSGTWTSSSGDVGICSDTDDVSERWQFVLEYNRLAKKHGVRLMVPSDYVEDEHTEQPQQEPKGRISRIFHRNTASGASSRSTSKVEKTVNRKRSVDRSAVKLSRHKKDDLRDEDVRSLVRLCGKSLFYLPPEYAPGSLVLPTCFRATAQFLVQHAANARGVFRIPGSVRIVNALYEYYCSDSDNQDVTGTVRCPNLPQHINAGVHDVASTFKRLLAGLPGGILGSLSVFDALVAIHSQLNGDPELKWTKQSKLRARLMALAVGTLKSQFRRELICAVFGLLSLIGRTAEIAPREDEHGRPLPTSDLMGYNALGIVFGPLLVGDLIDRYNMKLANPAAGLVLFPLTPPKAKKGRCKSKSNTGVPPANLLVVDKTIMANSITEMVVTHWREVVKHMKSLGVLVPCRQEAAFEGKPSIDRVLRPSASETFVIRKPESLRRQMRQHGSQELSRNPSVGSSSSTVFAKPRSATATTDAADALSVRRQRPRLVKSVSRNRIASKPSFALLSPPAEASTVEETDDSPKTDGLGNPVDAMPVDSVSYGIPMAEPRMLRGQYAPADISLQSTSAPEEGSHVGLVPSSARPAQPQLSKTSVRPSGSSSGTSDSSGPLKKSTLRSASRNQSSVDPPAAGQSYFDDMSSGQSAFEARGSERRASHASGATGQYMDPEPSIASLTRSSGPETDEGPKSSDSQVTQLYQGSSQPKHVRTAARVHAHNTRQASSLSKNRVGARNQVEEAEIDESQPSLADLSKRPATSTGHVHDTSAYSDEFISPGDGSRIPDLGTAVDITAQESPYGDLLRSSATSRSTEMALRNEEAAGSPSDSMRRRSRKQDGRRRSGSDRDTRKPPRPREESQKVSRKPSAAIADSTPKGPRIMSQAEVMRESLAPKSVGGGVRAMAAMFENAAKTPSTAPTGRSTKRPRSDSKVINRVVSEYTVSTPPAKSRASSAAPSLPSDGVHTPWRGGSARPEGSVAAVRRQQRLPKATEGESDNNSFYLGLPGELKRTPSPTGKFGPVSLRPARKASSRPEQAKNTPSLDDDLDQAPNLGKMIPPPEEPPVSQHLTFSKPPRNTSSRSPPATQQTPSRLPSVVSDARLTALQARAASPAPGNSVLHAQIRHLQRHLARRTDEVAQLRRQLETRANADVGLLSERLREARRECKMWRERAEAAERRVAAFERLTARIRRIRESGGLEEDAEQEAGRGTDASAAGGERTARRSAGRLSVAGENDGVSSPLSIHTEDGHAVAERIRASLQAMDGVGSEGGGGLDE